jgi:hypothetical protein
MTPGPGAGPDASSLTIPGAVGWSGFFCLRSGWLTRAKKQGARRAKKQRETSPCVPAKKTAFRGQSPGTFLCRSRAAAVAPEAEPTRLAQASARERDCMVSSLHAPEWACNACNPCNQCNGAMTRLHGFHRLHATSARCTDEEARRRPMSPNAGPCRVTLPTRPRELAIVTPAATFSPYLGCTARRVTLPAWFRKARKGVARLRALLPDPGDTFCGGWCPRGPETNFPKVHVPKGLRGHIRFRPPARNECGLVPAPLPQA